MTPAPGTKAKLALASGRLSVVEPYLSAEYELLSPGAADGDARVLVGSAAAITPALLDRLPALGLVALIGTGYDGIDRAMLAQRGIRLSNTPEVNAGDVADLALAMILALVRGLIVQDARIRSGAARRDGSGPRDRSMSRLRVGIVGLGAIGRACATRLAAFGSEVRWWGPRDKPGEPLPRCATLLDLARASDLLLNAGRAEASELPLIDRNVIEALGPAGMLVNVARGALVDEDAVIDALRMHRLAGAALDVFCEEPPAAERWADVPNIILSPHRGGNTEAAMDAMMVLLRANIAAFLRGDPLPSEVRPTATVTAEGRLQAS